MSSQAEVLAQATGLTIEQATALLDAQEALQAGVPVGVVMRNRATGETAVRVLSAASGVPVWSIVSADSPWAIAHHPPDLPEGDWAEMTSSSTTTIEGK